MKCLDQPIFCVGQRLQTLPQPVDALPMQGVDRNLFFPHQFGKPAAGQQFDLMARPILLVDRIVGILPVIVITRLVIDLLMDVSPPAPR